MELSNSGRPKRKGRQDVNYNIFFSDNIDEEELQEFHAKRSERFVIVISSSSLSTCKLCSHIK